MCLPVTPCFSNLGCMSRACLRRPLCSNERPWLRWHRTSPASQVRGLEWVLSAVETGHQEKAGRKALRRGGESLPLHWWAERPYHRCKYLFTSSLAFSPQEHPLYGNAKNAFSIINPSLSLIARILNNWVTTKILKIPLKQCLQKLGVAFCCHGDISRDRTEFGM